MLKKTVVCLLVLLFTTYVVAQPKEKTGGAGCIACTIGMKIVQDIAKKEGNVRRAVDKVCSYLPDQFKVPCKLFMAVFAGVIIREFERGASPDNVCRVISICKSKKCNMFTPSKRYEQESLPEVNSVLLQKLGPQLEAWWRKVLKFLGLEGLIKVFENHIPFSDTDRDLFATSYGLRGTAWRGKDCNDRNSNIYPGRKLGFENQDIDYNCNGIHGKNEQGVPRKKELCEGSDQRGVIIVGDSAGAHFRIPENYANATSWTSNTFKNLYGLIERELDFPHMSWATGYKQDDTGDNPGRVKSIYMRLKERNRCNHRDYQNICVNGARSGAMGSKIAKTMHRNKQNDHPAIVFYAPVGNDICTPRSTGRGTDPQVFYQNVLKALETFEQRLPKGSFVIFIGLVDGRILYNGLHNETHPLGPTYANVYDYLSCMESNPCWLWLNTNETWRNHGSRRAEELNAQYARIMKEKTYENFKMYYQPFPIKDMLDMAKSKGVDFKDLIEPFDGFHPSQLGQMYMTDIIWDRLIEANPEIVGKVNPNNQKIDELFKDQGGY